MIKINKSNFNSDMFLNSFIREMTIASKEIKIEIDLSSIYWFDDFKLTTFPYVINELSNSGLKIVLVYYLDDLSADDFYFKLCRFGFFNFCRSLNIEVITNLPEYYDIEDLNILNQFKSFYDLLDEEERSKEFLYKITKSINLIEDLLNEDVFGKTDVAKKISNIICRELIENINQHSSADTAIVRLNYLDRTETDSFSGIINIPEYFDQNKNKDFFILCASDFGIGIVESIKNKYKGGNFIPPKGETLKEIEDESTSEWLRRAFRYHLVPEEKKRTRIGLAEVFHVIKEYGGMLYVKSGDASLTIFRGADGEVHEKSSMHEPKITGTHFAIFMPCVERMGKEISIFRNVGWRTDTSDTIDLKSVDIAYDFTLFPISKKAETSYKKSNRVIEALINKVKNDISSDTMFQIDFSSAINLRANDYVAIIEKVYEYCKKKFTSNFILRNVSMDIIEAFSKSNIQKKLIENEDILFLFDLWDRMYIFGATDELLKILPNLTSEYVYIKDHSSYIINILDNNDFFIKSIDQRGNKTARIINFNNLFNIEFNKIVKNEIIKSNSIVDNNFILNGSRYVHKYIIAEQMFRDYSICRYYAKKIAIKVGNKKPTIFVSYSNTGIILYYYLSKFYFDDLSLCLYGSRNSVLSFEYGREVSQNDTVLIVTDVALYGHLNIELANLVSQRLDGGEICSILSLLEVGEVDLRESSDCFYRERIVENLSFPLAGEENAPVNIRAPGNSNMELPDAYEWHNSGYQFLCPLDSSNSNICENEVKTEEKESTYFGIHLNSGITREAELARHWSSLEQCFQDGHVERNHVHFWHYDIPERVLFNRSSRIVLEYFIKEYVWSFIKYVDYIIHQDELTATMLAHIVASKFNKKPKVIGVKKSTNKKLVFPRSFVEKALDKEVLIVDDAINTGATMKEMIGGCLHCGAKVLSMFVIASRCEAHVESFFRSIVPKVAFAYKLDMDVYQSGNCLLCDEADNASKVQNKVATAEAYNYLEDHVAESKYKPHERQ